MRPILDRVRSQPALSAVPARRAIQEAIAGAGDPRGQKWAIEAVNALRGNEFCRDSGVLHLMADKPELFEVAADVAFEPPPVVEQPIVKQPLVEQLVPAHDTDSNIAALQALRNYSRRWDENS